MPDDPESAQWEAEKKNKKLGQTQSNQTLLEWLTATPGEEKFAEIKQTVARAFKAAGKAAPPSLQEMNYWTQRIMARIAHYQILVGALKKQ